MHVQLDMQPNDPSWVCECVWRSSFCICCICSIICSMSECNDNSHRAFSTRYS